MLKYDSQESYFADSAAVWTDNPGNRLVAEDGTVLATAGQGLELAYLGRKYRGGRAAAKGDAIGDPTREYREQARRLHAQPQYANRVYGHAVIDSAGDLWLQYWFFYFYNDYNLIGRIIKAGLHEGDWEMVQICLGTDETPRRAVYTQHANAEQRDWGEVDVVPGTERPFVYVARGSHAGYFEPGTHWTGYWFDYADAKRRSPELTLDVVDDDAEKWRWMFWPGSWGDTKKREGRKLDSDSPRSPGSRRHWDDPRLLMDKAKPQPAPAGAQRPTPPPPPQVRAEWDGDGRIRVLYHVLPTPAGERPTGLVVTINSREENAPPTTEAFAIDSEAGAVTVSAAADPARSYDVFASCATREGLASESVRRALAPASG